jgi:hypothetical protein
MDTRLRASERRQRSSKAKCATNWARFVSNVHGPSTAPLGVLGRCPLLPLFRPFFHLNGQLRSSKEGGTCSGRKNFAIAAEQQHAFEFIRCWPFLVPSAPQRLKLARDIRLFG